MPELTHAALCTKNNRRIARFYQMIFGMEEVWNEVQNSPYSFYLGDGRFQLNCLQIRSGSGRVKIIDGKEIFPDVGINHLGFQVPSNAEVERKLAETSPAIKVTPSRPDGRYEEFRFDDLEGNPLELSEGGWPAGRGTNALKFRHVGVGADDPVRLAEFYKFLFALKEVRRIGSEQIDLSDGFFSMSVIKVSPDVKRGIQSFGFQVPRIADIESKIKATMKQYTYPSEAPIEVHRSTAAWNANGVWLRDPDGNRLDLSEEGWAA